MDKSKEGSNGNHLEYDVRVRMEEAKLQEFNFEVKDPRQFRTVLTYRYNHP